MKKVAIIGAGFAGLALTYHLLKTKKCTVTLFDKKGVGGGASGVALGLVHPYPGEQCRRSKMADEGIAATRQLLDVAAKRLGREVANFEGVIRVAFDEEAIENLCKYDDVERLDDKRFFIKSGITVFTSLYLEGLWLACKDLGAQLVIEKIEKLEGFDLVIIAAGAGSKELCPSLNLKLVKGQVLGCKGFSPEKSIVGKGYIAKGEEQNYFQIGSTYERNDLSEESNVSAAIKELKPKYANLSLLPFPEVVDCKAAFRVTHTQGYFPLMKQLDENTWAVTAFGSRGLLYHALVAQNFLQYNQ